MRAYELIIISTDEFDVTCTNGVIIACIDDFIITYACVDDVPITFPSRVLIKSSLHVLMTFVMFSDDERVCGDDNLMMMERERVREEEMYSKLWCFLTIEWTRKCQDICR